MSANLTATDLSLDRLLSSAQDGVFVLDRHRRYVVFNEVCQRITGYKAAEVVGRECRCADVMNCRDDYGRNLSGVLCPAKTLLNGVLDSARQRMQIRCKDGSSTWIETNYTVVRDDAGEIEFVLGVVRDVSEAKAREDDLREEMTRIRDRVRRLCEQQQTPNSGTGKTRKSGSAPQPSTTTQPIEQAAPSLHLDSYLERVERQTILRALDTADGQRSRASQLLGISRSRLYRRMDALGIDPNSRP